MGRVRGRASLLLVWHARPSLVSYPDPHPPAILFGRRSSFRPNKMAGGCGSGYETRPSQEYAPEAEKGRDGLAAIEISSHLRIKVVGVNRS